MKDQHIIDIFLGYDQLEKLIYLDDGTVLTAWNIAWGYDIGDEYAHVTTNISPEIKNASIDYFYTNQIERIEERSTGKTLFAS